MKLHFYMIFRFKFSLELQILEKNYLIHQNEKKKNQESIKRAYSNIVLMECSVLDWILWKKEGV